MPPRRKPTALPKACAELKAALGEAGVTAQAIGNVDHAVRVRAFSALNSSLKSQHPSKVVEYKALTTDDQRREWLAAFIIDPESGGCCASNTTERSSETADRAVQIWVTVDEYGGPRFLNNMEHAKIAVSVLQDRLHENAALAAAGVKEYDVTKVWREYCNRTKETFAVTVDAKITASEYQEVANAMATDGEPPKKKGRAQGNSSRRCTPPNPPAELSAEQLVTKQLKESMDKTSKEVKGLIDKMGRELTEVELVENRLKTKSWSPSAVSYLQEETAKQVAFKESLHKLWTESKGKKFDGNGDMEAATASLKTLKENCEKEYKKYKSEVLAPFASIK